MLGVGQAQQAVQGTGTQINTFGARRESLTLRRPEDARPPTVDQAVLAGDRAIVAALGSGLQVNAYLAGSHAAAVRVSVAAPLGRRDPDRPVRGRDELVARLCDPAAVAGPVLLCGLGGCGKTTVAVEVAARLVGESVPVWWVSAVDETPSGRRNARRRVPDRGR